MFICNRFLLFANPSGRSQSILNLLQTYLRFQIREAAMHQYKLY